MSEQPQRESVSTASILEQYERFVIGNYPRTTLVVDRAEGSYFWDLKGRRILDLCPAWGCGAIGHCHPRVVNAVREQVGRLIHIDNTFYTVAQGRLAEVISRRSFGGQGPWNVLGTFTVATGYFQDRLLPSFTLVYEVRSNSGAFLPSLTYRFTESFSATLGLAAFWGRQVGRTTGLTQIGPTNRVGRHANKGFGEPGLSVVRERDEIFLRVKQTF